MESSEETGYEKNLFCSSVEKTFISIFTISKENRLVNLINFFKFKSGEMKKSKSTELFSNSMYNHMNDLFKMIQHKSENQKLGDSMNFEAKKGLKNKQKLIFEKMKKRKNLKKKRLKKKKKTKVKDKTKEIREKNEILNPINTEKDLIEFNASKMNENFDLIKKEEKSILRGNEKLEYEWTCVMCEEVLNFETDHIVYTMETNDKGFRNTLCKKMFGFNDNLISKTCMPIQPFYIRFSNID